MQGSLVVVVVVGTNTYYVIYLILFQGPSRQFLEKQLQLI